MTNDTLKAGQELIHVNNPAFLQCLNLWNVFNSSLIGYYRFVRGVNVPYFYNVNEQQTLWMHTFRLNLVNNFLTKELWKMGILVLFPIALVAICLFSLIRAFFQLFKRIWNLSLVPASFQRLQFKILKPSFRMAFSFSFAVRTGMISSPTGE